MTLPLHAARRLVASAAHDHHGQVSRVATRRAYEHLGIAYPGKEESPQQRLM